MKIRNLSAYIILFLFFSLSISNAFEWLIPKTTDTIAPNSTISIKTYIINNSNNELSIKIWKKFKANNDNFTSSFCVGQNCFPPFLDTINFNDFGTIKPNDTLELDIDISSSDQGMCTINVSILDIISQEEKDQDFNIYVKNSQVVNIKKIKKDNIKVFPNPFNPTVNIFVPSLKNGSITIYDLNGKKIEQIFSGNLLSPTTFQWQPTNLSSGIYILKVKANNFNKTLTLNYLK